MRLGEEFADWCWRPRYCGGEFDFGDEAYFRRGVDLFVEMVRKRYSRARPITPAITRQQFGLVLDAVPLESEESTSARSPKKKSKPPAGTAVTMQAPCERMALRSAFT